MIFLILLKEKIHVISFNSAELSLNSAELSLNPAELSLNPGELSLNPEILKIIIFFKISQTYPLYLPRLFC